MTSQLPRVTTLFAMVTQGDYNHPLEKLSAHVDVRVSLKFIFNAEMQTVSISVFAHIL